MALQRQSQCRAPQQMSYSCGCFRAIQQSARVAAPVFQLVLLVPVFVEGYVCKHAPLQGLIYCDGSTGVPHSCTHLTCAGTSVLVFEGNGRFFR